MSLNKQDRDNVIKSAKAAGYTQTSDNTYSNGSSSFHFSSSGGSVIYSSGRRDTSAHDFNNGLKKNN